MGDPTAIALDTWMAQAFGIEQRLWERPQVRQEAERRLTEAAKLLRWQPRQVQASIWGAVYEHFTGHPAPHLIYTPQAPRETRGAYIL